MSEWFKMNVNKLVGDIDKKEDVLFAANVKEAAKQLLWRLDDGWVQNNVEIENLLNNIPEEKDYTYFKFDYKGEEVKAFIDHTKNPLELIKK